MIAKVLTFFLRNLGEGKEGLTFPWPLLIFLCSIEIHWNKMRPFMCLENVTEHLLLNLRNPLSTSLLCPHLENLQELFYTLQFPTYTTSLVLWALFSSLRNLGNFPLFSTQSSLSLLWLPISSIRQWRALREPKNPSSWLLKNFQSGGPW